MNQQYFGSCLCNAVRFSVTGFSEKVANCHCTMCRKFHGAAFGTLVGVTGLTWRSGAALIYEYVAPNGTTRSFCAHCGSSLGFRVAGAGPDQMEMAIATFDEDIPVKVDAQIYTKFKANWCELADDIPSYQEGRTNA